MFTNIPRTYCFRIRATAEAPSATVYYYRIPGNYQNMAFSRRQTGVEVYHNACIRVNCVTPEPEEP